jgi:hypothetical protein
VLEQLNNRDPSKASIYCATLGWQLVKNAQKFLETNEVKKEYSDGIYHRPDKWAERFLERLYPGGITRVRGHKAANVTADEIDQKREELYSQFEKAARRSKALGKPELIFINIDESPTQFRYQSTHREKLFTRSKNKRLVQKPASRGQTDDFRRTSAQLAHSTSPTFNREVLTPSFMMCQKGGTKIGKRGKPVQLEGSVQNHLEKAFKELKDGKLDIPEFRPRIYNENGTVTKKIFLNEMKELAKKMEQYAEKREYTVYYVLLLDAAPTHKGWKDEFPDGALREATTKTIS